MEQKPRIRLFPVLIKATSLFVLFNFVFVFFPLNALGKLSLYNSVFPGRERLPYGDVPESYSVSLFDLESMFSSHVIAGSEKTADEYRVLLIGDSSVWGTLLKPGDTLAGQLNASSMSACGKNVHAYNLGYPTISLMKDLLILNEARQYQPDMIIWLVTLEAFPKDKQLSSPIVANNGERVRQLIYDYQLSMNPADSRLVKPSQWDQTFIGRRRDIADLLRLQIYGELWASTGIDQVYPENYEHAQIDLDPTDEFHGLTSNDRVSLQDSLAFDVLDAGMSVSQVPILLINEPTLVSNGANSDIRYNFFYPRWAYDDYRQLLLERSVDHGWNYLDLWDLVPMQEFTNSAVHLTPKGEAMLTNRIADAIQNTCK